VDDWVPVAIVAVGNHKSGNLTQRRMPPESHFVPILRERNEAIEPARKLGPEKFFQLGSRTVVGVQIMNRPHNPRAERAGRPHQGQNAAASNTRRKGVATVEKMLGPVELPHVVPPGQQVSHRKFFNFDAEPLHTVIEKIRVWVVFAELACGRGQDAHRVSKSSSFSFVFSTSRHSGSRVDRSRGPAAPERGDRCPHQQG